MAAIGWNAVRLLVSWSRIEPRPGPLRPGISEAGGGHGARLAAQRHLLHRRPAPGRLGPVAGGPAGGDLRRRPRSRRSAGTGRPRGPRSTGARRAATRRARARSARRCWPPGRPSSRTPRARRGGDPHPLREDGGPPGAALRPLHRGGGLRPHERAERLRGRPSRRPCRAFYARALDPVRAGERAGKGRRHLVLFEPSVLWSATGSGAPPAFRHDRDVVYAPHIYTGGFTGGPIARAPSPPPRRRPGASAGRPCCPGSGAQIRDRAGRRRRLLPAPPGAPGPLPRERHALDLAGELRRPAQGRRSPRGARGRRGVGRVRGELPDQPGHAPAPRADRRAHPGLRAGRARAARVHPLAARARSWRAGARRAGTGRSWPSCPLTGRTRRAARTSTCPPTA